MYYLVLVLLSLALIIGIRIATVNLITCLDISNGAKTIISAILYGMTQGLHQP
jgi:hypothetical protein